MSGESTFGLIYLWEKRTQIPLLFVIAYQRTNFGSGGGWYRSLTNVYYFFYFAEKKPLIRVIVELFLKTPL